MPVIKIAQANYDNGTDYEVLHYETQASQVKILDASGNVTSSVNEALLAGKVLNGVDLNTIKTTGLFRVTGGTNLPAGMDGTKTYLLSVKAIEVTIGVFVVHQQFTDHINMEIFHRTINGGTVGSWMKLGKTVVDQVGKIGVLTGLQTTAKGTLVDAINELQQEINQTSSVALTQIQGDLDDIRSDLVSHNHDGSYLKLSGGSLTDNLAMANNKSFSGKNTSGSNLIIGKVNATNDIVLGDVTAKTIIQSKTGDISLFDGTTSQKIFHSGNDGSGSGLDADSVDGLEANQFARKDVTNYLEGDQFINNGKSVVLKAPEGSSQAGSIYFRDGSNVTKGRVTVQTDGDMSFFAGTINGHTMKASGELFSTYRHIMDSASRENRLSFQRGSTDAGIGLYMNTSGAFGLYDWDKSRQIFTVDRTNGEVNFAGGIKVSGKQITISTSAPLAPATGDIWIDI